jgi:hypothetical protein
VVGTRPKLVAATALAVVISACGGGTEPASVASAPSDTITTTTPVACSGADFRARVALYQAAGRGEIAYLPPPTLGAAAAAVPEGLFTGVAYAGCHAETVDGLGFEQMMWTNGIGVLSVSWQQWPDDGPLVALPFGGEARQAGIVQVSAIDTEARERTRIVNLFDGRRVITVASYALTTLSVEQLEEISWAIYDALPLPGPSPASPQRGVDELLAAIDSDTVSVSALDGVTALAPFTENLAMPVVTRSFIAGGATLFAYDFGAVGATDRAQAAISSDGYTIARNPYAITATPRFWRWDRIILTYQGDDPELLARLLEVLGQPFAGPEIVTGE